MKKTKNSKVTEAQLITRLHALVTKNRVTATVKQSDPQSAGSVIEVEDKDGILVIPLNENSEDYNRYSY